VEELSVWFVRYHSGEMIDSLSKSILEMAKLRVLRINICFARRIDQERKNRFLRAIDACATLKEIYVADESEGDNFSRAEIQLLQDGRSERNNALRRLVANPSDFPGKQLLTLMLQLENCPTGRFQLARALPAELYRRGNSQTELHSLRAKKKKRKLNI